MREESVEVGFVQDGETWHFTVRAVLADQRGRGKCADCGKRRTGSVQEVIEEVLDIVCSETNEDVEIDSGLGDKVIRAAARVWGKWTCPACEP